MTGLACTHIDVYYCILGGYGDAVSVVDALGSRQFLMFIDPELCTLPSAIRPLHSRLPSSDRRRALDVGAGIGRVSQDVLLHLFSDVVLVEPVTHFVQQAYNLASMSTSQPPDSKIPPWKGLADATRSITILQGTIQSFDPSDPLGTCQKQLGRVGFTPSGGSDADNKSKFDVVWCQWCLGHLSDKDLVLFFKRSHAALKEPGKSFIVVKENLCRDTEVGSPRAVFDEQDSSLTR